MRIGITNLLKDDSFREFVNSFTWTYAKTDATVCPHEYIVKDRISEDKHDLFEKVVRYIRENGFTANYKGRSGQYFILDDHYYWTMGALVEETTILNRAKLSEYNLIDNCWVWNGDELC